MPRYDALSRLQRELDDHLLDPSISLATKQWARQRRQEIRAEYERATREDAKHDFVLSYIQREATKFKAYKHGDAEDHPYEGTRTRVVCTCDTDNCPLKREELPGELVDESLSVGVRRFRHAHAGHPVVLDDAIEAWADLVAYVENALAECVLCLANDEIPDRYRDDTEESDTETDADATAAVAGD